MSELKFRPRFRLEVNLPEEEVANRVKSKLTEDNPNRYLSTITKGHLVMRIHPSKKHFWSPQMDISLETLENDKTLIRCLLAPEPAVWTMFMFFYTAAGFGAFIGLILGMSQVTLERSPWGFWLALVSGIVGGILVLVAQFGKGLAKEQMQELKDYLMSVQFE